MDVSDAQLIEEVRRRGFKIKNAEIQKKDWIGLTDADIDRFVDAIYKGFDIKPPNEIEIQYFERLIKFIDRKLKEKNNG